MKNELEQIAYRQGRNLVETMRTDNGIPAPETLCEGCTIAYATVIEYGGSKFCPDCAFHDLYECQARWGTIVDHAMQGLADRGYTWFNDSRDRRRIRRAMRSGVFAGITAELFPNASTLNGGK